MDAQAKAVNPVAEVPCAGHRCTVKLGPDEVFCEVCTHEYIHDYDCCTSDHDEIASEGASEAKGEVLQALRNRFDRERLLLGMSAEVTSAEVTSAIEKLIEDVEAEVCA